MTESDWDRIKGIVVAAAPLAPGNRDEFLDSACGTDEELRREVESLLAAHDRSDRDQFLDSPFLGGTPWPSGPAPNLTGHRIGPYRLGHEIGRGGMGTVWIGERADGQFAQRVAIKLIRPDRGSIERARFTTERQILARLNHPFIARLLDGGVTEHGDPYLVMEYVDGVPVTEFMQSHRLSLDERIHLFREICEAVQYSHANLVVHRDLKPSNILVTSESQPRLLDFGIAKLIEPEGADARTRTAARSATPAYASPEQLRGQPITIASDIYSLGVLLFEILTDSRPYDLKDQTPAEIDRIVGDQEAPRASAAAPPNLRRALRGDLDTIVAKALRKEPERRYRSVAALGDDLDRFLNGHPVEARPDSASYRAQKFLHRNRALVLTSLAVLLSLIAGITATTYQARRAERRLAEVREIANVLLFRYHDAIRDVPGTTRARRELVSAALRFLAPLEREAGNDAEMLLELAEAYERVGAVQGDPHHANLGDLAAARTSYEKARALRERVFTRHPENSDAEWAVARSLARTAVVTSWGGDNVAAIDLSTEAIRRLDDLLRRHPDHSAAKHELISAHTDLAYWLTWDTQFETARYHFDLARRAAVASLDTEPNELEQRIRLARNEVYRLDLHAHEADWEGIVIRAEDLLTTLESMLSEDPNHSRVLGIARSARLHLGRALGRLDRHEAAIEVLRELAAESQAEAARNPEDRRKAQSAAAATKELAQALWVGESDEEALQMFLSVAAISDRALEEDPANVELWNGVAVAHQDIVQVYLDLDVPAERALPHAQRALEFGRRTVEATDGGVPSYRSNLALMEATLGDVWAKMGHQAEDTATRQQSYERASELLGDSVQRLETLEKEDALLEWIGAYFDGIRERRDAVRQSLAELKRNDTR